MLKAKITKANMTEYDINGIDKDYLSIKDFVEDATKVFTGFNNTKMYHLTYSYHMDLDKCLVYFGKLFKTHKNNILYYSIVLENGEDKSNPHTHVALKLEKGLRGKKYDMRFFDYKCPLSGTSDTIKSHPHIRKVTHPGHWNTICIYHHKEENANVITNYTPNWNSKQKFSYTRGMIAFKDGGRAGMYKHIGNNHPDQLSRAHNIYDGYKMEALDNKAKGLYVSSYTMDNMPPCFKYILNLDLTDNRDDVISVAVDAPDIEDKKEFTRFLQINLDAMYFDLNSGYLETMKVVKDQLSDMYSRDILINLIIFNVRDKLPHKKFYKDMECLRDGYFNFKIKNTYNKVDMESPIKILIMTNFVLDISPRLCGSINKWKAFRLHNGKVQHVWADKTELSKDSVSLNLLCNNENFMDLVPLKYWPIELYSSSQIYIWLINEMIINFIEPEITIKYRLLTTQECHDRYINILSPKKLYEKIFPIKPYPGTKILSEYNHGRSLSRAEVYRGRAWVVKDISGTQMTPEQIEREKEFLNRRIQYEDKISKIEIDKHKEFAHNKFNLMSLNSEGQKFPSRFQVIDNPEDIREPIMDIVVPNMSNIPVIKLPEIKLPVIRSK